MVKLGPIREEARAVLSVVRAICEDHDYDNWHDASAEKIRSAINAICADPMVDLTERAESFDKWVTSDEPWISDWTRNVSRFCAAVLRWTQDAERVREMLALNVLYGMCVFADPDTKAPTNGGWAQILHSLSEFLGYDVRVEDGITLRHGRLSFDREKRTFVFSWG